MNVRALHDSDLVRYIQVTWRQATGQELANHDFLAACDSTADLVRFVAGLRRSGFAVSSRDLLEHHTVQSLTDILPERFGCEYDDYPSFAQVWATAGSRDDRPSARSLTNIVPGSGTPLFVVHSALGYVRFVKNVVDLFCDGRPVYGFESIGIRDYVRPPLSIRELVELYVTELREVQPNGPYTLIGMCMGGQVAYEMANRIISDGDDVAVLAVVNSPRPGVTQVSPGWGLADLYNIRIARLQLMFSAFDLSVDLPRLVHELRQLNWVDDVNVENFYWHAAICAANAFAQEHYDAGPYLGTDNIAIFQPRQTTNGALADWTSLAPHASVHDFDADNSLAVMATPQFAQAVGAPWYSDQKSRRG